MILKEKFIFKCLTRFYGQICVFCDVDIQFYAKTNGELPLDLENCLGDNDICFLKDHADQQNGRGAGFFVLRSNSKTVDFFSKVLKRLEYLSLDQEGKGVNFNTSEQGTINDMLSERKDIRWNFLPERYYTHGKYTNGIKNPKKPNGAWWDQKDDEEKKKVFIPDPILVHHANWCTGVKNKIHLLDFVEKVVHDRLRGRCYRGQEKTSRKNYQREKR